MITGGFMCVQKIIALIVFSVSMCSSAWCAPVKAYVAEFSVSGAVKPDETKTTIQSLLLSRLASDNIMTVTKPDNSEIRITGSYLLSGVVFSLDAVAVSKDGSVITRAFAQGNNPDELIPAIGMLAKTLGDGINRAFAKSDIVQAVHTTSSAGQIVHKLDGALNGVALGRRLPGGERELFVTGNHVLRYYRQEVELKLVAEIPYKVYEKVLAVDCADLDNNTIPEIYVTIINGEELVSQVWTVDGNSLKQIAGPLPYFFRAITGAGGIKKLYAQKISGNEDFFGDVAELSKTAEGYKLVNSFKLPKLGYLYNFNFVRSIKSEFNPIIIDRTGSLRVFTPLSDELWKSSEEFSGSETSFKRSDIGGVQNSGSGYRQVFLDQRIIVKANGEIIVPKNSGSWFSLNKHSYSNNILYDFEWNGSSLEEKWHTRQSEYYLADFAFDDATKELFALEVVSKEEGVFDKGASRLVIRKVE
jgi:hypothetical protein